MVEHSLLTLRGAKPRQTAPPPPQSPPRVLPRLRLGLRWWQATLSALQQDLRVLEIRRSKPLGKPAEGVSELLIYHTVDE